MLAVEVKVNNPEDDAVEIVEDVILTAIKHRCSNHEPVLNVRAERGTGKRTTLVVEVEDRYIGIVRGSKCRTEQSLQGIIHLLTGGTMRLIIHPLSDDLGNLRSIRSL